MATGSWCPGSAGGATIPVVTGFSLCRRWAGGRVFDSCGSVPVDRGTPVAGPVDEVATNTKEVTSADATIAFGLSDSGSREAYCS
jgi:hypothetical protein